MFVESSGAWVWSNEEAEIACYASPFWETNKPDIFLDFCGQDGETLVSCVVSFQLTGKGIEADIASYREAIRPYLLLRPTDR